MSAEQWVPILQAVVNRRGELTRACTEAAYAMAFAWHRDFADRLERVSPGHRDAGAAVRAGAGRAVRRHIDDVLAAAVAHLGTMGPPTSSRFAAGRCRARALHGVMTNADQVVAAAGRLPRDGAPPAVRRRGRPLAEVMRVMGAELLTPLRDALGEAMIQLEQASSEPPTDVGLARLSTDQYAAWPADADELVPGRFAEANNEVLLINSAAFKARYEADLPKAVAGAHALIPLRPAIEEARPGDRGAVADHRRRVRPGGLIERTATWVTRALGTDPENGRARVRRWRSSTCTPGPGAAGGRGSTSIGPANRSRSSARCRCATSSAVSAPRSPNLTRRRDIATKFTEALSLARPLASVNDQALQRVHPGQQAEYRYKFSEIPFAGQPVAEALGGAARQPTDRPGHQGELRPFAVGRGRRDPRRHLRLLPELLAAGVRLGAQSRRPAVGADGGTRARRLLAVSPLAAVSASLPMTDVERRAMTAGWFLGQLIGRIQIPASPYTEAVRSRR